MNSYTEENYLKAIFSLSADSGKTVSTNDIAAALNTKAASVTDMLKKLSDKKLIHYKKYQGVSLTAAGKKIALKVVRKHRLWETFLVSKLGFRWDQVHEIAEQLEHIQSAELITRLDEFLGRPRMDPHGDPIPDQDGRMHHAHSLVLSKAGAGVRCVMTGVIDHSPVFLRYLDKIGISIGTELMVEEIHEFDNSFVVLKDSNERITLSREVVNNLLVSQVDE